MNFITTFDYDGNLNTADNRDHLMAKENGEYLSLEAALYYAVVETETHLFVTYHFYHPRDQHRWWPNVFFLWGSSHENDGENIQLVIRKGATPILEAIAVEAHLSVAIDYPKDRQNKKRPTIFVQSGKHALELVKGEEPELAEGKEREGNIEFFVGEIDQDGTAWSRHAKDYVYRLIPIRDTLWDYYVENKHLGDCGVMDGYFTYKDASAKAIYKRVPRHYNSNRMSALIPFFKFNAGILPFAFDRPKALSKRARLFFDPAEEYKRLLGREEGPNWSTKYIYHPYRPNG